MDLGSDLHPGDRPDCLRVPGDRAHHRQSPAGVHLLHRLHVLRGRHLRAVRALQDEASLHGYLVLKLWVRIQGTFFLCPIKTEYFRLPKMDIQMKVLAFTIKELASGRNVRQPLMNIIPAPQNCEYFYANTMHP